MPAKLDDEIQGRIARLVEVGVPLEVAAQATGITKGTLAGWLQRGRRTPMRSGDKKYRALAEAVDAARAQAEATLVARISKAAASGSWQAAAWLLERRAAGNWTKVREKENADDEKPAGNPAERIRDELEARRQKDRRKRAARARRAEGVR